MRYGIALLTLLFLLVLPGAAQGQTPKEILATPCEATVPAQQVAGLSSEISRRWQVAFARDIYTIRKGRSFLSRKTNADETNAKIRDVLFELRGNRAQLTRTHQGQYQTAFFACLTEKSKIRYQQALEEARQQYVSTVRPLRVQVVRSGRKFKKALRQLRVQRKNQQITQAVMKRRVDRLVAARKAWLGVVAERIVAAHNTLATQKAEAGRILVEEQFQNESLSRETAATRYSPILARIKNDEPEAIKRTFQNTRDHLVVLHRRAENRSAVYRRLRSGVPKINWQQIRKQPMIQGAALAPLLGHKKVVIEKLQLAGRGGTLVVGDSIALGMKSAAEKYFPNRSPLDYNAVGGYNSMQIYGLFQQNYQPRKHSVIVFDAGTNDNPNYPSILRSQLSKVADRVGPRRCIIVPTVNTLVVGGTGAAGKNEVIRNFVRSREFAASPNWAGESKKGGLMYDSLHPNATGNKVRARMIAEAIKSCLD